MRGWGQPALLIFSFLCAAGTACATICYVIEHNINKTKHNLTFIDCADYQRLKRISKRILKKYRAGT